MPIRLLALLVTGIAVIPAGPVGAQQVGLAAGYVRMPGKIGDERSDQGLALRASAYLGARSPVSVGLEVGFDRLNERYSELLGQSCILPGGSTGTCNFRSWVRDRALSASLMVRMQARTGSLRPYALAGLGILSTRTHDRTEVTDGSGNRLENFSHDGTTGDGAGLGHVGGGVAWLPGTGPWALTLEGRAAAVLHNYSGGPQLNMSPSILAGVRWGGR